MNARHTGIWKPGRVKDGEEILSALKGTNKEIAFVGGNISIEPKSLGIDRRRSSIRLSLERLKR